MKVLLINTYDTYGGAAVACKRVFQAIRDNKNISSAHLLVQQKDTQEQNIEVWSSSFVGRKKSFLRFVTERLLFLRFAKNRSVQYAFSPANVGVDISQHPLVQEADIIHLHWTTFGFLSLRSLQKLANLNKPIVWTLHDMWAFTGGCHYTGDCRNFQVNCGNCQFLKRPHDRDLSYKVFQKKFTFFSKAALHIVTSSRWLAQEARQSSLIKRSINSSNEVPVRTIPTPIDHHTYAPVNKVKLREELNLPQDKFLVLFGAMNIADKRKGFKYFKDALDLLKQMPINIDQEIALVIFGKASAEMLDLLPYPTHNLGVLSGDEKIAQAYNAASLFVIPSLEDNLPNTIIESLACGTPVVAFDTGGIPDMVEHQQNGYLAKYKSAEDLAKGIHWVWQKSDTKQLANNARQKVLDNFTEEKVSNQYIELYKKILDQA